MENIVSEEVGKVEFLDAVIKSLQEGYSDCITAEDISRLKMISQELDYMESEYADMVLLASAGINKDDYRRAFDSIKIMGDLISNTKEPLESVMINVERLNDVYRVFAPVLPMMEKADEIAEARHVDEEAERVRMDKAVERGLAMMKGTDAKRHALALRQMAIFGRDAGKVVADTMMDAAQFLDPE